MRIGMKAALCSFALAAATSAPLIAQGTEFTACVVDTAIPDNPVYYYLPTTATKLRCEISRANYHPTLRDLYSDGWRLVTMMDPKVRKKPDEMGAVGGDRPSPVIYLERDGMAAANQLEPVEEKKEDEKKQKIFGLF